MLNKYSFNSRNTFYSDSTRIDIEFHKNGGLSGLMTSHPFGQKPLRGLKITNEINGLYAIEDDTLHLAFFFDSRHPDTNVVSSMCFNGVLFSHDKENKLCLVVRWVNITPPPVSLGTYWEQGGVEVMLNSRRPLKKQDVEEIVMGYQQRFSVNG